MAAESQQREKLAVVITTNAAKEAAAFERLLTSVDNLTLQVRHMSQGLDAVHNPVVIRYGPWTTWRCTNDQYRVVLRNGVFFCFEWR